MLVQLAAALLPFLELGLTIVQALIKAVAHLAAGTTMNFARVV